MQALPFESVRSTPSLGSLYERRTPFRLTPRLVFAVSVVGTLQAALGLYLANQTFERIMITPVERPVPTVTIQDWKDFITEEKPVQPPRPTTTIRDLVNPLLPPIDTLPITPSPERGPIIDTPADLGGHIIVATAPPPTIPAPPPPVIANPKWLSMPTAEQLNRLYPERAERMDKVGGATLLCEVTPAGAMTQCDITAETPKGWKFGEAALAAARYFKISPPTSDGKPIVGARVRIPIVFSLE